MVLGLLQPHVHRFGQCIVRPVAIPVRGRRIDDAGDMARTAQHKTRVIASLGEQVCTLVGRFSRGNVILGGGDKVGRQLYFAQINRDAAKGNTVGLLEQIIEIHVAQIKAVHRRRHAR